MSELILPTEIPWEDLGGRHLEECLYWLMHALGAKDLEWRLGGSGESATDGGRDLEARFFVPGPDGEITHQKWWLEAKGRSVTVEPAVVKSVVLNASGRADLDVLIVATNTTFSNPTRDWVATWQLDHRRPLVRLWDRHHLERLLTQHPEVVIRLFSRALSPQGKLDFVRARFWNFTAYAGQPMLEDLWHHRDKLTWSDDALVATLMSECANGSIDVRPWALTVPPERRLRLFLSSLLNIYYFASRASDAGVAIEPYVNGTAYLLLACLHALDATRVLQVIESAWRHDGEYDAEAHDKMRHDAMSTVLDCLFAQLADVCTSDCRRVASDPSLLSDHEIKAYWSRLKLPVERDETDKEWHLTMESLRRRCKVGFKLSRKVTCPLVLTNRERVLNLEQQLATLQTVARARGPAVTDSQ